MSESKDILNEERHLAVLLKLRAERIIKLIDTKRAQIGGGIPDILLEKDRDLLGVATVLWVGLHPTGDGPADVIAKVEALRMVHEGMGWEKLARDEEEYTRHLVDHESFGDAENQDQIKSGKPTLTLHKGGKNDDSNS